MCLMRRTSSGIDYSFVRHSSVSAVLFCPFLRVVMMRIVP